MIRIEIPGREEPLRLDAVALDYNGTIAVDGMLIEGLAERIRALAVLLPVYVLTADTYGTVRRQCDGLGVEMLTFPYASAGPCKAEIVQDLVRRGKVCAIGNGFNDIPMFEAADFSVAVLEGEGLYAGLLEHADVLVRDAADALDLLLRPNRLRATLRN